MEANVELTAAIDGITAEQKKQDRKLNEIIELLKKKD